MSKYIRHYLMMTMGIIFEKKLFFSLKYS